MLSTLYSTVQVFFLNTNYNKNLILIVFTLVFLQRNQCDTILNQHGHDGDFLIRDSETNVSLLFNTKLTYNLNLKKKIPLAWRLFCFVESTWTQ